MTSELSAFPEGEGLRAVRGGMSRQRAAARAWATTPDRRLLLAPLRVETAPRGGVEVAVDLRRTYQPILGFGGALTDSSAFLLARQMSAPARERCLRDLFGRADGGIGLSVLRLPMGASDFSSRGTYTYDDTPGGGTDPDLKHFSIASDREYILPLLRRIRQINPQLTLIASPWTAPAWMKTSRKTNGGWLDWPAYGAYARYFVRFLQAYAAEGVPVDYITPQNEPRLERDSYPTMRMEPRDQIRFVRDHLGPELQRAGLSTRILIWDHNWDAPEYPLEVLADAGARRYIAGTAFHGYAGKPEAQEKVRAAYPNKEIHFTESSGGEWAKDFGANVRWDALNLVIGAVQYGARSVLKWNLILDQNHGPTNGGCTDCRGLLTLDRKTGMLTRNEEYWTFAHVSRFLLPGARRVESSLGAGEGAGDLHQIAFRNPDNSAVLILCNTGGVDRGVVVRGRGIRVTVPAGGLVTVQW